MVTGIAQAVLGTDSFFPVCADLERDVLRILLGLQEHLDQSGVDSVVRRGLSGQAWPSPLAFHVSATDGRTGILEMNCTVGPADHLATTPGLVSERSLEDGSFVKWLQGEVLSILDPHR